MSMHEQSYRRLGIENLNHGITSYYRALVPAPIRQKHFPYTTYFVTRTQTCTVKGAQHFAPRAGSGVVRIDPLRFLAGCRTRRLTNKPSLVSVLYLSIHCMVSLFIRAPFYVLLLFIAMCAVFWLFWLSYQYLPSDWLGRLVCAPILLCFLGQLSHLPYSFWR